MPKEITQDFPIQFPTALYHDFYDLSQRGLITPTYLSGLIMLAVLPAKFIVGKKEPLKNNKQGICTASSLSNRANLEEYSFNRFKTNYYDVMMATHTLSSLSVEGLETLEAKQKKQDTNQQYEIFFCGNGQDAMDFNTAYSCIAAEPNKNHVFWNYPGVGSSTGNAHSTNHLFKAGYQQAKRLLNKGILAENITFHGLSLGGGVAIHVARQLHEEGHLVNLKIDRSFARIASVIPAKLINEDLSTRSKYDPSITSTLMFTSTITLALFGVALGTTFSGLVASMGLVTATAVATVGYTSALCLQAVGFLIKKIIVNLGEIVAALFGFFSKSIRDGIKTLFNNIGNYLAYPFNVAAFVINKIFSTMALFIDSGINLIGSIVGAGIAIGGLVAGSLTGFVFSMLLSIQLLWTDKPWMIAMTPAFSAVLRSSCCEMDSVSEMHRLLNADNSPENRIKEQPKIQVTNVIDDEVIDVVASLNMGLGLKPGKQLDNEHRLLKQKITSFWYRSGGHMGTLEKPIDPNQSFSYDA